jgi:hypothetical protein
MKLVFRTTQPKPYSVPSKPPTALSFYKNVPVASPTASLNSLETRWVLGGNMIERVRPSGEPCGSCGGR